jgi:hypothetical protein
MSLNGSVFSVILKYIKKLYIQFLYYNPPQHNNIKVKVKINSCYMFRLLKPSSGKYMINIIVVLWWILIKKLYIITQQDAWNEN